MPSASVKLEHQGSQDALDPFHKVMNLVEKKTRNLEKRKNKLEQYRVDLQAGKQLNEDQQQAVANYDRVLGNLEVVRELNQQFTAILTDHNKLMKKQAKREQLEKQQEDINKMKDVFKFQEALQQLVQEEVRADFLAGTNGAVQVSAEVLDSLQVVQKLTTPTRVAGQSIPEMQNDMKNAAEHMVLLREGKNKEVAGSTYKALLNMVEEIANCPYPERKPTVPEEEEEEEEEVEEEQEPHPIVETQEEVVPEYTNGLVGEEEEEVSVVAELVITSPVTEGPPPGLAPPSAGPLLSPSLPQEPTGVTQAQEALAAAMAQMNSAGVPGASQVAAVAAAGLPPAPSYFTQAPPPPVPQTQPPQQSAPQPPQPSQQPQQQPPQPQPPQQTPLQPPPPPQLQPISLNDLVAPGSFDFLQESQVAQEPPTVYMDPAVVSIGSIKTDSVTQRSVSPVPQPPQQVSPLVPPSQDPTHPSSIPTQTFTNQSYNVASYSQGVPVYPSNTVVDSTPNPPPPIPLPPQARPQEKVEFNPEASPWTGQQVPPPQPPAPLSNVPQPPPPQPQQQPPPEEDWGAQDIPMNGGEEKWGSADGGNWGDYEEVQGGGGGPHNGHGDYDRRGGFRGRGRGFGRGNFRGGRGNYQNGRGGYGGYGGFRGGRGGMGGGPRGGRGGFRGQGMRGNFRGRGGPGGGGYPGPRGQGYQQQ
ncbi:caprin-1-like isoform X1 [Eriocheir sinensis]|uniref:caprin-1-like isoform X1 n=1 Tax=Eriocheir sinensis TaxID=95602 RepID=UPI0021C8B4FE|nr:caprin-1-like isoform X1 [Eriocheir sinensis]